MTPDDRWAAVVALVVRGQTLGRFQGALRVAVADGHPLLEEALALVDRDVVAAELNDLVWFARQAGCSEAVRARLTDYARQALDVGSMAE